MTPAPDAVAWLTPADQTHRVDSVTHCSAPALNGNLLNGVPSACRSSPQRRPPERTLASDPSLIHKPPQEGFLRALSDLIGDYSYTKISISSGKTGSSRSRQEAKERIFGVSNLAELDRGRAVVLASGAPATLVRTMPWYTGPHKDAVEASITTHSPRPEEPTLPVAAGPVANPWVTT